jgi:hypothetical protein
VDGICPHTHEPLQHRAGFDSAVRKTQACQVCGGRILACPHCAALNRTAARFCRACGEGLTDAAASVPPLANPGELRRRIDGIAAESDSVLLTPLADAFSLPEAVKPVYWAAGEDGLFLFVELPRVGSVAVYRAELADPRSLSGTELTGARPLPRSEDWLQEPILGEHGLFVADHNKLHYFPTAGDDAYLTQREWILGDGLRIASFCICDDGTCALIATGAPANSPPVVQVLAGNAHTRGWQPALEVAFSHAAKGYASGQADGAFGADLWIHDGAELVFVALGDAPSVRHRIAIDRGLEPPGTFKAALHRGFFTPCMLRAAAGGRHFVFPGRAADGGGASISVLDLATGESRNWGSFRPGDWLRTDSWGEGLLVCHDQRITHMTHGASQWEEKDGSFVALPPALSAGWMVAVQSGAAARQGGLEGRLQLHVIVMEQSAEKIALESHVVLNTKLAIEPALAPVASGDWLIFCGRPDGPRTPAIGVVRVAD